MPPNSTPLSSASTTSSSSSSSTSDDIENIIAPPPRPSTSMIKNVIFPHTNNNNNSNNTTSRSGINNANARTTNNGNVPFDDEDASLLAIYNDVDESQYTTRDPSHKSNTSTRKGTSTSTSTSTNESSNTSIIPGTQTLWLKTYGCSHNTSDSEYMEGQLASYGYSFTSNKDDAELWILNSCTVKDPSQASFINEVNTGKGKGKKIIVCGCVPQGDRKIKALEGISTIGVLQIDRIIDAVEQTLNGNTVRYLSKGTLPSLELPKVRKNPFIEIIPLSTGCLGNCTYCKTKHSRGKLGSYSLDAIINRAKTAVEEGVMEVWLSSEDTGAYGIDIGTSLSVLLERLVCEVPGEAMFRVGMSNPPYWSTQMKPLAQSLNHPRIFSFVHIPVQSGSNHVLKSMNREYTIETFKAVCYDLIENVEGITIATDVICGFPNEREEHFEETIKLMEEFKFGICNISQFYPRPGTPAAKMKRIDTGIVKNRSRRFSELFNSLTPYAGMEGKTLGVWVGMESDKFGVNNVGHAKNYIKVIIPWDVNYVGCHVTVVVHKVERFHVEGAVVEGSVVKRICPLPAVILENIRSGDETGRVNREEGGGKVRTALINGGLEHAENRESADVEEENADEINYRTEGRKEGGGGGGNGSVSEECCGGGDNGECCGGGSDGVCKAATSEDDSNGNSNSKSDANADEINSKVNGKNDNPDTDKNEARTAVTPNWLETKVSALTGLQDDELAVAVPLILGGVLVLIGVGRMMMVKR